MSAINRMEKVYNCLENYRNNCNNKEHKKLVDIIFPMIYQVNKHHLEISIGKKISETKFNSALSMFTDNFIVGLDCWKEELLLIIKYAHTGHAITSINMDAINNLKIKTNEDKDLNFCSHFISFNYNNEFDYNLHIVMNNE